LSFYVEKLSKRERLEMKNIAASGKLRKSPIVRTREKIKRGPGELSHYFAHGGVLNVDESDSKSQSASARTRSYAKSQKNCYNLESFTLLLHEKRPRASFLGAPEVRGRGCVPLATIVRGKAKIGRGSWARGSDMGMEL